MLPGMPSQRAQRDLAWLLLAMLPALAVLAAWVFAWPMLVGLGLALVVGLLGAALVRRRVIKPKEEAHARVLVEFQSARSAADQRLADLARQLGNVTATIEEAPWPMFVTDGAGNVVVSNRSAEHTSEL